MLEIKLTPTYDTIGGGGWFPIRTTLLRSHRHGEIEAISSIVASDFAAFSSSTHLMQCHDASEVHMVG